MKFAIRLLFFYVMTVCFLCNKGYGLKMEKTIKCIEQASGKTLKRAPRDMDNIPLKKYKSISPYKLMVINKRFVENDFNSIDVDIVEVGEEIIIKRGEVIALILLMGDENDKEYLLSRSFVIDSEELFCNSCYSDVGIIRLGLRDGEECYLFLSFQAVSEAINFYALFPLSEKDEKKARIIFSMMKKAKKKRGTFLVDKERFSDDSI